MKKVELAVIINSFNRLSLLKKSLSSLVEEMKSTGIGYAIVLFDANSTDGSIGWIREFIEKHPEENIKLMISSPGEPDSFSYGVNAACAYAADEYKELNYYFLYETDNVLLSGEPLKEAKQLLEESEDLAACGFTVKKYDGTEAGFGSSFPSLFSFLLGQQFSFAMQLTAPKVRWIRKGKENFTYASVVYTSPLLVRKSMWQEVEGFDHVRFPFSDCDIDLAKRIQEHGKKMGVIQTDKVIHDNAQMKSSWSATRTFNFYRARFTYFRKHYGNGIHLLKPLLFLMHFLELCVLGLLVAVRKRNMNVLEVRWDLMKKVFVSYR